MTYLTLKMTADAVENDTIVTTKIAVLKNPYTDTEIVSLAPSSRSHFSPGLDLILQTQVTIPEHGMRT